MKSKIWLSSPHMGGGEMKYIEQAFRDNWVAPLGENIDVFEELLEQYLGSGRVLAVNTGTAALHLALILLGIKAGDEVLCQSLTFAASANPIVYQGATPIFIDSEKDTWNICPDVLERAIQDRIKQGKKIKAIIIVHLYGMPAKMKEIIDISKKYKIPIIEDAAEALGSVYLGKKCGTFGDYAIFSFNGNKIITTSGGGVLITREAEEKEKALHLATQAKDNAIHYQHSKIGYNYRMSNIVAGIGRGQMEVLEERIAQRRANHRFYQEIFGNIDGINLLTEPNQNYYSNHWLSVIQINKEKMGDFKGILMKKMKEGNIECRPVWKPLHLQPVFKKSPYYGGVCAENLFENGLCLPSGSNLTFEHKERIKRVIKTIL